MPTFTEQLVLLTIDEDGTSLPVREDSFVCALAGAALMDLAFGGRIDTDLQALVVTNRTLTSHLALDRVLTKIAARDAPAATGAWIRELCVEDADAIRDDVLAGFVERGALRLRPPRMPWRARGSDYVLLDTGAKREVLQRIEDALLTDAIPHPRDIALISLLDACDMLADLLPAGVVERSRAPHRPVAQPGVDRARSGWRGGRRRAYGRPRVAGAVGALSPVASLSLSCRCLGDGGDAVGAPHPHPGSLRGRHLRAPLAGRQLATVERLFGHGDSVAALASVLLLRTTSTARLRATRWWRFSHIALGTCGVGALFLHTGFRLGANVHAALMSCFLAALLLGALVGVSTGGAQTLRKIGVGPNCAPYLLRLHIAALVPLPALLAIHVLVVYLY